MARLEGRENAQEYRPITGPVRSARSGSRGSQRRVRSTVALSFESGAVPPGARVDLSWHRGISSARAVCLQPRHAEHRFPERHAAGPERHRGDHPPGLRRHALRMGGQLPVAVADRLVLGVNATGSRTLHRPVACHGAAGAGRNAAVPPTAHAGFSILGGAGTRSVARGTRGRLQRKQQCVKQPWEGSVHNVLILAIPGDRK